MYNPGKTIEVDEYIILDVYGEYYFYPTWTQDIDKVTFTMEQGPYSHNVLNFVWPSGAGSAQGIVFWGALCYANTFDLASNVDREEFSFE